MASLDLGSATVGALALATPVLLYGFGPTLFSYFTTPYLVSGAAALGATRGLWNGLEASSGATLPNRIKTAAKYTIGGAVAIGGSAALAQYVLPIKAIESLVVPALYIGALNKTWKEGNKVINLNSLDAVAVDLFSVN